MSTRADFSFGRGFTEDEAPATLDDVRELLRGSEVGSLLEPATIDAQTARQGSGVPISKIRRGLLGPLRGRTSGNYTVTSTNFVELDGALLAGTLVCTGRPVRIDISAGATIGTSTGIILSASMDGVEVTGTYDGLAWAYQGGDLFLVGWTIITPRPGPRRFAFVAKLNTAGSGTVYSSTLDVAQLAVTEL